MREEVAKEVCGREEETRVEQDHDSSARRVVVALAARLRDRVLTVPRSGKKGYAVNERSKIAS